MKSYYLAYGSNLNLEQMSARCPTAKPVGTARLKGWRLSFKGSKTGSYLTIDRCPNGEVPVAVWEVHDTDVRSLDRYEGYPEFYDRHGMTVHFTDLKTGKLKVVHAFVYIMTGDRPTGIPTNRYLTTCLQGYGDFGFNRNYLLSAYHRCEEVLKREA